ncbi:MAG TPA: hypothetical protein VEI98_04065 [Xanthobacteraceae bacterium]|nr:hypothetical protein [Xanthobacteraceae bacterium]
MNPLALSSVIFVSTLGGIFLGTLLRRALPKHHLSKDSQDIVKLGAGLIATIAALVLGLLIAAAKSSFDTQNTQIKQITANIILLDNLLAQYGPETRPIREQMRSTIGPFADRLWREKEGSATGRFEANAAGEKVYLEIQALSPQNDLQRSLQARAAQISTDLAQTRILLFVESDNLIPAPFLAILVFWLVIIFASFSLFSELNVTVFIFLSLFALSASCAIFLILELSQPFSGLMMISSAPLRNALGPL